MKSKYEIKPIYHPPYHDLPAWHEYLIEAPNGVIICRCSSFYAAKRIKKALDLLKDKEREERI